MEFALTLPVFLALVFGLIDFGLYFAGQAMLDSLTGSTCESGAELDPLFFDVKEQTRLGIEGGLGSLPFLSCADSTCEITVEMDGVAPLKCCSAKRRFSFRASPASHRCLSASALHPSSAWSGNDE